MTPRQPARRLAAVVFTDIVGYSAYVHRDEALGERLLHLQRRVVRRIVPLQGGREVETAGDSFLLEFGSALAAVSAVIAIQQSLARESARAPAEPAVTLRASIHLGDVEHRGRELYGDGVNIAARLLPHSPEGGMALSAPVLGMIRQRMALPARSIGVQPLKNISSPVEIFVVEGPALQSLPPILPGTDGGALPTHGPARRIAWATCITVLAVAAAFVLARLPGRVDEIVAADKSVAVLPFVNLSEDKANAYFADGVQDEILTALSRIAALKVISRTSTEQYRDKPHDLPMIAKALGVASVLEGGVQRAGNRVRINVQLIDARTDAHLWAETYDRDVTDLFAVQSEVARQVAQSLRAKLLIAEANAVASIPTQNPRAYDLYLQARYLMRQVVEQNNPAPAVTPRAIALYEEALAEDRRFALAAAGLSYAHMQMYFFAPDRSVARLAAARNAADRALGLQPDLGEGHFALGVYQYWGRRDYAAALEQFELARRALPGSADVAEFIGFVSRRQGRWDAALRSFTHATTLDPGNALGWIGLGETYGALRRYAEASAAYGQAVAVGLDPAGAEIWRALVNVPWNGDLAPLRTALAALPPGSEPFRANAPNFYFLHLWSHDYGAALDALATNDEQWVSEVTNVVSPKALLAARAYAARGDRAHARLAYAQAAQMLDAAVKEQPDDPDLHIALGLSLAGLGRDKEALNEGQRAVALRPASRDAYSGPVYLKGLAEIYAAIGDRAHALEVLRQVLAMPAGLTLSPALLRLDPFWEPLRKDPRFQALVSAPLLTR